MNMKCEQFVRILEQQEDGPLPKQAAAHLQECGACRALSADLGAIRDAALELSAGEETPPERVWIELRNQLEAEGLIREAQPASRNIEVTSSSWWSLFQRPAIAGAFLALLLTASGAIGFLSNAPQVSVESRIAPPQEVSPTLTADNVFREEILTAGNDSIAELEHQNAAVTQSIRRNLQLVDNLITICEKSVREQPDNQMARDYLYGAYQQKAELLATAMNRGMTGGLQ
jgi:hypothetical protein